MQKTDCRAVGVKKKSQPKSSPIINGGLQINLNTILTSALGAFLIWLMTNALSTGRDNGKSLITIQATLPSIEGKVSDVKQSVTEVQKDLKDARAVMVTRDEMNTKQTRTEAAIKDVKDEQVRVRDQLSNHFQPPKK